MRNHRAKRNRALAAALALLFVVGCAQPAVVATTAQETPVPAVVTPAPTPEIITTVIDYDTPAPEKTPLPTPDPTPTPEPTDTPAPTEIPFSYYAPTMNMSFEELVGSLPDINTEDAHDESLYRLPTYYPSPDTYMIVVDLYWQVVAVYSKDEEGNYTVPVRYMLCSSGSTRVGSETRVGNWPMEKVKIRFGQFKVSREYAQYWSLIRSKTYFHSILYTTSDLSTYQENVYNALGTKASHACVRLTVPDARWIYYNICYDTLCVIREGSKNDDEMRKIHDTIKNALPTPPPERVKIIPGQQPYTDNWTIDDIVGDPNYPYVAATQPPIK